MGVRETLPAEQRRIRDRCYHPTGTFIEFEKDETEQSIPARFEQQVRKYPDKLAVKSRSHELTYDELNNTANRLARSILAKCGEEQEQIALLLDHDLPIVIAILGILKAGEVYVPLDPEYPRARIQYILEDSEASLIVTNNQNLTLAVELSGGARQILNIDELDTTIPDENLDFSISPDALVYILYTSGSTGQPKGVMDSHRNVLHYVLDRTNVCHFSVEDRIPLLLSCSFSGSVTPIFNALLNGAGLYLYGVREQGLSGVADWLMQEEITVFLGSQVVRETMGTLKGNEALPRIRLIFWGAMPLYKKDVELYKRHFSNECVLVNALSATEAKSISLYFMDKQTQISDSVVPTGHAAEETEIILLDDEGNEVGVGHVGEIAVRSRYMSPGYWRRPELTESRFLTDPDGGPERTYLTGDLGRKLADGCLIHLGRKDFQVKVRGHRVEVLEVESALLDIDNIKETVVTLHEYQPGDQRLVGYFTPNQQPAPGVAMIRRALAAALPDYMVPSTFVMLDALPLTPNGKVDRSRLPEPGGARPELDSSYVAPRTPTEEKLAEIWAGVLCLDKVGIADSFLDLGGHSLLATQVISRVITDFEVELPLQSLFGAPTVADMGLAITQSQAEKAGQADVERMLADLETLSEAQVDRLPPT